MEGWGSDLLTMEGSRRARPAEKCDPRIATPGTEDEMPRPGSQCKRHGRRGNTFVPCRWTAVTKPRHTLASQARQFKKSTYFRLTPFFQRRRHLRHLHPPSKTHGQLLRFFKKLANAEDA